jgi:hypothetical protein
MTLWVITCFTYFSMYNPIKPFFLSLGGTQPWATYEHWILQRINPALVPWTPSFICCGDPVSFLVWLKGPNLCYGLQYLYIQYTYTHSIYIYIHILYIFNIHYNDTMGCNVYNCFSENAWSLETSDSLWRVRMCCVSDSKEGGPENWWVRCAKKISLMNLMVKLMVKKLCWWTFYGLNWCFTMLYIVLPDRIFFKKTMFSLWIHCYSKIAKTVAHSALFKRFVSAQFQGIISICSPLFIVLRTLGPSKFT